MTRQIKRPLRWYVVWGIIYFILASSVIIFILSQPFWQISNVEVKGAQIVDAAYIAQKAAIPIGDNLFFMKTKKPLSVVKSIWQLEKVTISRHLPSTIIINVVERQPYALAVISKEASIIDKEGVILKIQNKSEYDFIDIPDVSALPVVTGLKGTQVAGHRLVDQVRDAISLSITRFSKFFDSPSLQIDMQDFDNISIFVSDVLKVKVGSAEDLAEKMDVLEILFTDSRNRLDQINYLDVRLPKNPVICFRKS